MSSVLDYVCNHLSEVFSMLCPRHAHTGWSCNKLMCCLGCVLGCCLCCVLGMRILDGAVTNMRVLYPRCVRAGWRDNKLMS